MKSTLLILTLQASFGEFVRDGLDPARFEVFFTSNFSDAVLYVRHNSCPTVLLDVELDDVQLSVLDIGYALRQIQPDIQFVVIARAGQELDTASLSPVATLPKPISLPDLGQLLEKLAAPPSDTGSLEPIMPDSRSSEHPIEDTSSLSWTSDVSRAAQQLTQLTLESSAQAAFITREHELWAYAGQLSREAAQELTDSIQRYWNSEGESDLLRFVRLQATEAQHMLYVRKLAGNMTLALVFDAETPFSTIRSQAGKLVKNLFETTTQQAVKPAAPVQPAPVQEAIPDETDNGDDFHEIPPISELLGEVPPPNPTRSNINLNLPWDQPTIPSAPMLVAEPLEQPQASAQPQAPSLSEILQPELPPLNQRRPMPAMDETFSGQPAPYEADHSLEIPRRFIPDDMQVTRKHSVGPDADPNRTQSRGDTPMDGAHRILLEPPFATQVNLTYTCVLIPRFEHHHLVGNAASRLNEWIPQLCVAYGWRLEYISVRPDYFQWIVRVPLNTAAGSVINAIRKHTSERFFNEFPRFKADNPSGEFWAHGFIVQGGSQPTPQKVIKEFIQTTRMRQGLR